MKIRFESAAAVGAISSAASMFIAHPALAQDSPGPAVQELVVTAQRRAERLEDVPISITAVTGTELEKAGIVNIQDVAQISTSVNISHLGVFIQPTIRGITSQTGQPGQDNNVAVYVDGVYQASSTSLNQDLVNVESLQVLKGPQGTLFGRNSTAGAILIETLDPSFAPTGRLRASYGRFNEVALQGYYSNGLIEDVLAFDLAGYYRRSDGYLEDVVRNKKIAPVENYFIRSKILLQPIDGLRMILSANYNVTDDPSTAVYQNFARNLLAFEVPGTAVPTRPHKVANSFDGENQITTRAVSLDLEYDLGWGVLKSITSGTNEHLFLLQDSDGTPVNRFYQETHYYYDTFTEEVNLNAKSGPLDWVLGAFYYWQDGRSHTLSSGVAPSLTVRGPLGAVRRVSTISKAAAVYLDGTYNVTDRLTVIGGIRYSWEEKTFKSPFPITTTDPAAATAARPFLANGEASKSWNSLTPRIVLQYALDEDSNVYASFSKGFKSGTYGGALPAVPNPAGAPAFIALNNPADPEKVSAYEIGYKTQRRNWRFSAAAFYYDYKDMQVQSVTVLPGTNNLLTVLNNAASSKIYGVELEAAAELTENLSVKAGAAWNRARYDNFPLAQAFGFCPVTVRAIDGVTAPWDATGLVNMTGVANPCTDVGVATAPAIPAGYNTRTQGTMDRSNDQMLRAPDWTFNLSVNYRIPTSTGEWDFNISAAYSSSFPVTDLSPTGPGNPDYRLIQPAYVTVNGEIGFSPVRWEGLTASIYGRNLTNEVIYSYPVASTWGDRYIYMPPRVFGVKVDYEF